MQVKRKSPKYIKDYGSYSLEHSMNCETLFLNTYCCEINIKDHFNAFYEGKTNPAFQKPLPVRFSLQCIMRGIRYPGTGCFINLYEWDSGHRQKS